MNTFEEGETVVCVKPGPFPLTAGKEYKVRICHPDLIYIRRDDGEFAFYYATRFEKQDEKMLYVPEDWS